MDLPRRSWLRWSGDAGEQNGKNAGEKNAVECSRAADRGDRSAKTGDLVEIEKIGTNESPHRAADIGKWRRVFAGEDKCEDCRGHDGRKYRYGDANSRHRRRQRMNNNSDGCGCNRRLEPELISYHEIRRH